MAKDMVVKRQITKRRIDDGEGGFEEVAVFELEVKFSPATSVEMSALGQVSQKVYSLHDEGKTITIEYANENPLVFVLEGEI